jgi:hypothetical protein
MIIGKVKGSEKMLQMAGKFKLWERKHGVLLYLQRMLSITFVDLLLLIYIKRLTEW